MDDRDERYENLSKGIRNELLKESTIHYDRINKGIPEEDDGFEKIEANLEYDELIAMQIWLNCYQKNPIMDKIMVWDKLAMIWKNFYVSYKVLINLLILEKGWIKKLSYIGFKLL